MPERLIPISKKQHDLVNELTASIKAANDRLSLIASTLIAGSDEDIDRAGVEGARCDNGVYSLVLTLPDIAPAVEQQESA
jgi:hypothetical protein